MQKTSRNPIIGSFLIVITTLIVSGCMGGKSFRMEIGNDTPSGKVRSAAIEDAQAYENENSKIKKLPDPTGDEFEHLGDALLGKGSYYLAYVHYEKSLGLKPDNMRVEYKKGLTLLLADKNDDAIEQFDLVLKKDPQFSLAYEGLGRACFQKKAYSDAEKNFRKAVQLNTNLWRSFDYLGNICDLRKQHEMAIVEYTSAIQVKPDVGSLYNNLGVSYSMAGKPEEAAEAFEMAIERNFRESKVYNNLGLAFASTGKYDEALDAFIKGGGEAQGYNNMGVIYLHRGRYADAIHCFETAIELEPSFYAKAGDNLKKAKMLSRQQ